MTGRLRRVIGRWLGRWLAVLGAAVVVSVLVVAPASAHNRLVAAEPVDGSTVAATPAAVVLTFDEPSVALGTQVVVAGPAGPVSAGAAQLVDNTVRQELAAGAPAGRYTVSWRVTSNDGHPITGQLSFTSAAAGGGTAAPSPAPEPSQPAGPPITTWLVAALVLLGSAATVAVVVRRRRSASESHT